MVQAQIDKTIDQVQKGVVVLPPDYTANLCLPETGLDNPTVKKQLEKLANLGKVHWKAGKVSGTVYHGGKDLETLITNAFRLFCVSNPLHPDVFPGVRIMESEIIAMILNMYNGSSDACGSVTSGGTESILMSLKAHRDWALETKGITKPELYPVDNPRVAPISAHAAFDKGCHYFGIQLLAAPVDPKSGEVSISAVRSLISANTIMLVGSTPSFPHGSVDDIPALAALALKHNIGLHVDSCLGGFLIPFMEKAGYALPMMTDFRVPGVTSISVDTHKYGFAPKGSSVVLYHSKTLRKFQYFLQTEWPGGVYGSPTMAGSRPGAISAGCWAAMLNFGMDGYVDTTKRILDAAMHLKHGIQEMKHVRVIGDPVLSVVAFQSCNEEKFKTFALADLLSRQDWHLNVLQFPPAIHLAITLPSSTKIVNLLQDINDAVERLLIDPKAGNGDVSAIYGTAASVSDRSIIADVTCGFLDALTLN